RPIDEKWHFGLGLYVPFGVISDYEKSFQGRNHGLYSQVQVTTLQPTVSYKINDRVAVGFGPTINKIDGKLTSNPLANAGLPGAKARIKGDDIAYGFNLGVLVDVTDRLSWGLSYRSKVDYKLEGHISYIDFPAPLEGRYDGSVDITMPESVDTSVTYRANDKWTLYAGSTWTRWRRLEELNVANAGLLGNRVEPLNWENSWAHAIGAAYQVTPAVVLRSGFAMDASPTNNEHRTVRIPVSNRKIYSLGLGWNIDRDWTLDVAYAYVDESKGRVSQGDYAAEYENSAHGLGVQLTHRFCSISLHRKPPRSPGGFAVCLVQTRLVVASNPVYRAPDQFPDHADCLHGEQYSPALPKAAWHRARQSDRRHPVHNRQATVRKRESTEKSVAWGSPRMGWIPEFGPTSRGEVRIGCAPAAPDYRCEKLAEDQGFEPWKGVNPCRFSRPVHSTALPTLHGGQYYRKLHRSQSQKTHQVTFFALGCFALCVLAIMIGNQLHSR